MFFTEVKIPPRPGIVAHGKEMWTIGSCFADEIGSRLRADLFQVRVNPCGTLYNPASIAGALQRIADGTLYTTADLFSHNGQWHCMDFHSAFSGSDPQSVLHGINTVVATLHQALPRLHTLMLTFGSAHIFTDRVTGRVAGNCHKLPSSRFIESDMTAAETAALFLPLLRRLRAAAPQLQVIFTVSPIRHKAYGYHADRLSKATLLLAVDEICRGSGAEYFPSYEIMNDELRDYRFYAADMIHPSEVACDHIYSRFAQTFFTPATAELADECRRLTRRLEHRLLGDPAAFATFREQTLSIASGLRGRHPQLAEALSHCSNLSTHQN